MKKVYFLIFFICIAAITSCINTEKPFTFFGGQIINPKSDYVVLFEKEIPTDTLYLDDNNRFLTKINNKEEGLFYFKHGNEFQYIYIEPKDSLYLRLNTFNFDESLVFSGKGAERNNFLMSSFLQEEKDRKYFYEYYKLPPKKFSKTIDSLLELKKEIYNEFLIRNPGETESCLNFLNISLTYPLFSKLENYPLNHARIFKNQTFPEISEDFYKHRKEIDFDKKNLIYYGVYSNYLTNYLYNKTYHTGFKPYKRDYSAEFTKKLLEVTAEFIPSPNSKNILLNQTIKYHFFRNSNNNINKDVFETYFNLNSNKKYKKQIRDLIEDTNKIKNGQRLSEIKVVHKQIGEQDLKEICRGKNAVIYFWNPKYMSEDFVASKIRYLSSRNKNVKFIGVKFNGDEKHIDRLNVNHQFYINKKSKANQFLKSELPRTFLVNKKGIIVNSFASLASRKIYKQVSQLNKN